MIRHYDERVQADAGPEAGATQPFLPGDAAPFVQADRAGGNVSEQAFPAVCAQRHEIRAGARIIVTAEAYGTAVVFVAVERHIGRSARLWGPARNPPFVVRKSGLISAPA